MPEPKLYCNLMAIERGLDPVGHAGHFDDTVVLEIPLPWKKDIYSKAGALPQEVIDLLALWLQRYRDGQPYNHHLLMVAPDAEYSRPGLRRVIYYARRAPMLAEFDRVEYLVPETLMGPLAWALHEAPDDLGPFEAYRIDSDARDLLVCTHGTVDAACAKFGYPLYNHLRKNHASEHLRVWRVSHFGGHVFAPTMMDMPTGHYWAFVETAQADQIVRREGNPRDLYGHYRGWAGVADGFMQSLERELWMEHGFAWFGFRKSGRILSIDSAENPQWAEVEIRYESPDGLTSGTASARVEVHRQVPVAHSSGSTGEYPYPQYAVVEARVPAAV